MHVIRHLPISDLSLPLPTKIPQRKIIIVKVPVNSFNVEFPRASENCTAESDSQVQKDISKQTSSDPNQESSLNSFSLESPQANANSTPNNQVKNYDSSSTESRPVNSVKLYCCTACMKGFCEEPEWKAHVEGHSETKSLICKICHNGYVEESAYERHLSRHNPRKPYACNRCGKNYSQSSLLTKHRLKHRNARPYRCGVCSVGFLDQQSLESHLEIEASLGFSCNICDKRFPNKVEYVHHFCGYSGKKPKVCGICDRVYFCSTGYNNHVRSHKEKYLSFVRS